MKILTLNLEKNYKWDDRKNLVIDFLSKENPDVILFQDLLIDMLDRSSQLLEINNLLNYHYYSYKRLDKLDVLDKYYYGFGILSKYPIKKLKLVIIPSVLKEKRSGFLHFILKFNDKNFDVFNLYLEDSNEGSKRQLVDMFNYINKNKLSPIVSGNFNFNNIENFEFLKDRFTISCFINNSNKKNNFKDLIEEKSEVLDYILVDNNKFEINNVKIYDNNISDHKPISATIDLIDN